MGDTVGLLENWYSKSDVNYSKCHSQAYDTTYEALLGQINPKAQKNIIEKLQQVLIDDFAVMVYGSYKSNLSSSHTISDVVMPMSESY